MIWCTGFGGDTPTCLRWAGRLRFPRPRPQRGRRRSGDPLRRHAAATRVRHPPRHAARRAPRRRRRLGLLVARYFSSRLGRLCERNAARPSARRTPAPGLADGDPGRCASSVLTSTGNRRCREDECSAPVTPVFRQPRNCLMPLRRLRRKACSSLTARPRRSPVLADLRVVDVVDAAIVGMIWEAVLLSPGRTHTGPPAG